MDRLIKKYEAIADLQADDLEEYEKFLRVLGWDRYTLGAETFTLDNSDTFYDLADGAEDLYYDVID